MDAAKSKGMFKFKEAPVLPRGRPRKVVLPDGTVVVPKRKPKCNDYDDPIPRKEIPVCHQCGKTFRQQRILELHEQTHNAQEITCGHCNDKFLTELELSDHQKVSRNHHACTYCWVKFHCNTMRRTHSCPESKKNELGIIIGDGISQTSSVCSVSSISPKSDSSASQRTTRSSAKLSPPIPATATAEIIIPGHGSGTSSMMSPNGSVMSDEEGEKIRKCNVCDRIFLTDAGLEVHLEAHLSPEQLSARKSTNPNPRNLLRNYKLKIHDAAEVSAVKEVVELAISDPLNDRARMECEKCWKSFNTVSQYKYHMACGVCLPDCLVCKQVFSNPKDLKNHACIRPEASNEVYGEKRYGCYVCEKKYRNSQTLVVHMQLHGTVKIPRTKGNIIPNLAKPNDDLPPGLYGLQLIRAATIKNPNLSKKANVVQMLNVLQSRHEIQVISPEDSAMSDVDREALELLRANCGQLLFHLVEDPLLLNDLGYPDSLIDDVVANVICHCDIQPSDPSGKNKLHVLRENIAILLGICVKPEVMDMFGWKQKPVDEVVKDMLEGGAAST